MEENIHIIALPPHTTHLLQPLDKAVFGPLNRAYNEMCSEFLNENPLNQVNKWTFPGLFQKSWDMAVTSSNIKAGFKSCGIYPFDETVIPDRAFCPSEPSNKPIQQSSAKITLSNVPPQIETHNVTNNCDLFADHVSEVGPTHNVLLQKPHTAPSQFHLESTTPTNVYDPFLTRTCTENAGDLFDYAQNPTNIQSIVESESEFVSPILDISDPMQLFQLISNGNLTVDPLTDVNGNEIVVEEIPRLPPNTVNESLKKEIEQFFIPQPKINPEKNKSTRKSITQHRLLTSEDIINEKLRLENIKTEKEKRKQTNKEKKQF
jgi:hypothetical protein